MILEQYKFTNIFFLLRHKYSKKEWNADNTKQQQQPKTLCGCAPGLALGLWGL